MAMSMINLNKRIDKPQRRKGGRSSMKIFGIILLVLIFLGITVFIPAKIAFDAFKEVQNHSKAIGSAYHEQNFGQIQSELAASKNSLNKADIALKFLFWLKLIPVVGGYYGDLQSLTDAGVQELTAFDTLFTQLKPKEKELGFLGQPLTGQDRITQGVKVLDASLPYLPKMSPNFKKAADEVRNIDTNKYPSNFKGTDVRNLLTVSKNFIVGIDVATTQFKDDLGLIPDALGSNGAKDYLILFQNDKELRPTGGFMTAYAILTIDKGKITTTNSDDIYHLDERLLQVCQTKICPLSPPAILVKYLPEANGRVRTAWSMRDSNISPDVPTAASQFESMYKLLGQGTPFDGIIYIDTQVVENLIEITGPIEVYGTKYSAETDKRCNCPNVIFGLESYAEFAAKGEPDRKAVLGVLMQQLLGKIIGADVSNIPNTINAVVTLANHKHIMFYMHDPKTQAGLSGLNWTGQIKEYDGDYLHINDANFAGGKTNIYVTSKVTQEIDTSNGKVTKKLTLEYSNPQPFNNWLNGINRDYVRIYVPKGAKLISGTGGDEPVSSSEDLNKTVFATFLTVRPQNSRKVVIQYEVPYQPSGGYKLLVQKQPGTKDFEYIIKYNGATKADVKLDTDKEFKF